MGNDDDMDSIAPEVLREMSSEENIEVEMGLAPVCPQVMYFEALKNNIVEISTGKDRLKGVLVWVEYKPTMLGLVSTEQEWLEWNKTYRHERLQLVPYSAVRTVTRIDPTIHRKIVEERVE